MYRHDAIVGSEPLVEAWRIKRVAVLHKEVFQHLLQSALEAKSCLRHSGAYWAPLVAAPTFGVYRRAPDHLGCFQDEVERYESVLYESLLRGVCGRDGVIRRRTRLWRDESGALRAGSGHFGGIRDQ
jgi:hypothetical protein